ncbi:MULTISPECIES: MFS transporter [unclassified Saccharopolyspora]|uniref:MFS transporter n=2 Tax=Saccharopolyspora TaxID=1835 RepID=UPI001CD433DB|nr:MULTISPECIES: MFS transporter [unclassified Saccharopolyspora]MCA1193286.1 MFS transporter [Saccharopolyspora sp. 6V]MCA1225884.1 MFS transporter [Saccharopolyspora sp. 6M]MCA1279703.1 MFS transporter [Saccharopolyspora sp. 7B]
MDQQSGRAERERTRRSWRSLLGKVVLDTRPLGYPAYRRLWTSSIVTSVGAQFSAVAVPKQLYDLTGNSAYVGLAGIFGLVPLLVFGLWGGAVADTVDRRKLLLLTNSGLAATAVLLWLVAASGVGSVWLVLVLFALQQTCFAVNMPTRSAAIARLIPAPLLPSAQALGSTVFQLGAVIGPLLAGVLLPVLGLSVLYLVDAVALTIAVWAVFRLPALPPLAGAPTKAGLRSVVDGFRYLGTHPVLLTSFLMDIIAMVFGMPRALFPELAERVYGDPPGGGAALGWLYAAIPLGAFAFGVLSGWLHRILRHGVGVTIGVVVWGVAIVGFGLSDSLWLGVLFLAIGGGADLVSMVYRSSMLQAAATDEMRGRIQGVFTVVVAGGPRLADVLHGSGGAVIGAQTAVAAGGVLVVVLALGAAVLTPSFWRYRAPSE